ncbi:hypothetical protein CONCODRAFT_67612 [Conidiobolus coronatus NRRL 28638]|uniref:ER membrane protein complex subunit 10 n=1 Tax=Conidiobolus coronatus (strain ATCC 28846 / CBS 209.66 / NRRL 28638) TaxID=796925 RepID=A0A137PH18_CONC2|nr:hypothetical protein CONCODRAFT_67612 [Conidiobolus coronatus NRRL 28638]|eukprot:KXN74278.1 hypothetical protein CONCODRAFT_67612 [Conidiobolus coronatus NRRL 28638]
MYTFKPLITLNLLLLLLLNFVICDQSSQIDEYPLLVSPSLEENWTEVGIIGYDKSQNTVDFTPTNHFQLEGTGDLKDSVKISLRTRTNSHKDKNIAFKLIQFDAKCPLEIELIIQDGQVWNFNLRTTNKKVVCEDMDPVVKVDTVKIYNVQEGPEPKYHEEYKDEFAPKEEVADKRSFFMKYWYIIVPVLGVILLAGGDDEPSASGQGEKKD